MRISDCSSDVCSSDLQFQIAVVALQIATAVAISERHLPLQSGFRLRARSALGERYPAWAAARDAAVATGHEQRQKHSHTDGARSEEHTSELQSLMRISYAVFCLKKKNTKNRVPRTT